MSNYKKILSAYRQRVIAFHTIDAKITGSITAGLLLSQLSYWWEKMDHQEFYKTNEDLCRETCLSIDELKLAKKKLINAGFVKAKLKGLPARTYYELDDEKIVEAILSYQNSHGGGNDGEKETPNQVGGKPTNWVVGNPPDNIDITTKITNKTLSKGFPKNQKGRTTLPEDIQLSEEWRSYILEKGIHPTHVDRLWDQFREHYLAKGDSMSNWKAALGKWCSSQFSDWAREEKKDTPPPKTYGNYKTPELLNKLPSFNQPEFVDRVSREEGAKGFEEVLKAISGFKAISDSLE